MNDEEYIQRVEGFIAHYGKKGMHWGIRNEDTTSNMQIGKKESKQASREKRAVKRDVLADKYNVKISEIKAKTNPDTNVLLRTYRKNQIKDLTEKRDQKLDDAQRIREGKLTKGQKKLAIGASIAAALLISYGAYKYTDSGAFHQQKIKGKEFLTQEKHVWNTKKSLSGPRDASYIMRNVVYPINPTYGKYGTKMNCRRCTFAYEMRRRGNDVSATLSNAGTGQTPAGLLNAIDPKSKLSTGKMGMYKALYDEQQSGKSNPLADSVQNSPFGKHAIDLVSSRSIFTGNAKGLITKTELDTSEAIFKSLSSQPNGARGELGVGWTMGGGHSMAWEIIGGKPHIFDAQNGQRYGSAEDFAGLGDNIKQAGFTRLDNIDLNDDFLKRWLRDA